MSRLSRSGRGSGAAGGSDHGTPPSDCPLQFPNETLAALGGGCRCHGFRILAVHLILGVNIDRWFVVLDLFPFLLGCCLLVLLLKQMLELLDE